LGGGKFSREEAQKTQNLTDKNVKDIARVYHTTKGKRAAWLLLSELACAAHAAQPANLKLTQTSSA